MLLFALSLWWCGAVGAASDAMQTSRSAAAAMNDPRLDDRAREAAARTAAVQLFSRVGSIVVRTALAAAIAVVPLAAASALGVATPDRLIDGLADWRAMLLATAATGAGYAVRTMAWRTS
jgi:hypothetical protein